jgi:hypothetical protein
VVVISTVFFFNFLTHDYYDAMLYDTNSAQRLSIIKSLDCRTYEQFYNKHTGFFIHHNVINYESANEWGLHNLGLCGLA